MEPVSKAVQRTQPLESSGTLLQTQCQKKREGFFLSFPERYRSISSRLGFFFHCWCFFFSSSLMCSFAISRQLLLGTHLHNALRVAGQTHHHQPSIHPSLSSIPATHPSPHPAGRCSAMHSATLSPWCTDLIYRGTNHGKAGIRSPLMEKKKKKKKLNVVPPPPFFNTKTHQRATRGGTRPFYEGSRSARRTHTRTRSGRPRAPLSR